MGLRKRGRVWWLSFSYQGQQIRRSTETTDKRIAEKVYHKVMTDIAEGKWFDRSPDDKRTFRDMMEKYMDEHSRPHKASTSRDERSLKHLLPFFDNTIIAEITSRKINEYKVLRNREGPSPCTVNRELALMKHAFSLAIKEWEWVKDNPCKRIAMEREPSPRDRWLTYEEEEKLLAAAQPWLRPIIFFAANTGCRKDEILSLTWDCVDMTNKVVNIFGKKTGERRSIPMTARVFEMLQQLKPSSAKVRAIRYDYVLPHPPGQKVKEGALRSAFERAIVKAGIAKLWFHDLRHTFATRLAQQGVDPYTIQRLMGHKTFSTTQRYAHHNTESLRRGITILEASQSK